MGHRLTAEEVSLLATDTQHTPGHVGTVDVLDAGRDYDSDALVRLIAQRLEFVPRYRMRVLQVPGGLAAPLWAEDGDFDLSYHVRRSALPRPGTMQQLQEFVGRVMARRLDRQRPLWEVYLVEGFEGDKIAMVTKTHQCLVDGVDAVDLGQVLFDETDDVDTTEPPPWEPVPEPRPADLLMGSVLETVADPEAVIDSARRGVTGLLGAAVAIGEAVGGFGGALGELAGNALRGRPPADSPLAALVSEQRRFETVTLPLSELKALRLNERYTVNDVVLALITAALRSWLQGRGDGVERNELLALVPMSVQDDDGEPTSLGSRVAPHLISLPIGEGNALMRLHQVSFGTRAHTDTGRAVAASVITDIAGFAPTTLHALGVRAGQAVVRKPHDLLITNVPGPQLRLYAAGVPMVASYPVVPLSAGHLLAIGVTSYNGEVYVGLNADRDELPDLDVLAQCLREALAELSETAAQAAAARQPTRQSRDAGAANRSVVTAKKAPGVKKAATAKKAPGVKKAATAKKTPGVKKAAKKRPTKAAAESAAAPNAVTPNAVTPNAVTPNAVTPNAVTPNAVTPTAVTPTAVTPRVTPKAAATKRPASKHTASKHTANKTADGQSTPKKSTPKRAAARTPSAPHAAGARRTAGPRSAGRNTGPGDDRPTDPSAGPGPGPTGRSEKDTVGQSGAPLTPNPVDHLDSSDSSDSQEHTR